MVRRFFGAGSVASLVLFACTTAYAAVTPPSTSITVPAGGSVTAPATVGVPALPSKADIEIAIDTTGSMAALIAQAQAEATALVTAVQTAVPDTQFAVVDFRDYNCDEPNDYVLRQPMTSSAADVQTAIDAMSAPPGTGCDNPEAYNLVFKNGYADAATGWRADSRKFLVVIGDAPPHGDNSVNFPDCGDQGPDTMGLDTATELAALKAAQRTLMMVDADLAHFWLPCYQELAAGGFAGSQAVTLGTSLATQIVDLITSAGSSVASVTMAVASAPAGADASWISFDPPSAGPLATPADVAFTIGIAVPPGTAAGTYTFDLVALADGGDVGHMRLDVVVPGSGAAQPLTMAKTASTGTAHRGDPVTYTITVHNPNGDAVTLRWLRDQLPRGFRYIRGSTTGADEPFAGGRHHHGREHRRRHGTRLIWRGPLAVPADGDLVVTFQARAGGHGGCVTDMATAAAQDPYTVTGTGAAAPVCVTGGHDDGDDDGTGDDHHGRHHHRHRHHRGG